MQYKRYERELEIQIYQFWNLSKYILKKSVVKIFFSLILTKVILTVTLDPTLPTFSYSLLFKLYIYIETHTDASDLRHIQQKLKYENFLVLLTHFLLKTTFVYKIIQAFE